MKIALMARNPKLYSHQRLVAAAEERGHEIDIIDTMRVYINVASHRPEMRYKGAKLEGYDAVIQTAIDGIPLVDTRQYKDCQRILRIRLPEYRYICFQ